LPLQKAAAQTTVGKPHALADEPSHVPWQVPLPAHAPRAPCGWPDVTVVQVPRLTSHAWHLPVHVVSQQKLSTQWPLAHALPAAHDWPFACLQVPAPSHARLVPQLVPTALLPPSTQVWVPVMHDVVPVLQMPGLPVHVWPAVHATQPPEPLHTMLAPQLVPAATLVSSTQVCPPVMHDVVPVLQTPPGLPVHAWFAVHATQPPEPLHTMFVPQPVPAALLPLSTQVCAPVVHDVVPVRQIPGLPPHAWFAVHEMQLPPPSHTWLTPQPVPPALGVLFRHICVPVLHDVRPV
jgi:hypothetical protein